MRSISESKAAELTGGADFAHGAYYYLVEVAYRGRISDLGGNNGGLKFGVDVDETGVAYITSFRLTSESGESNLPVVLASEKPLRKVVSICGSAD